MTRTQARRDRDRRANPCVTAEGKPKRRFASYELAKEFTTQRPEATAQYPYWCTQCAWWHMATGRNKKREQRLDSAEG